LWIGNNPSMLIKNEILLEFERLSCLFLKRFNKCKSFFSENSVHDLRVSIRKLSALCYALNVFSDSPYLLSISKEIKKYLKLLNPLRDTQVQILAVQNMFFSYPLLIDFYKYLLNLEKELIAKINKNLQKINLDFFESQILFLKIDLKKIHFENFDIQKIIKLKSDIFFDITVYFEDINKILINSTNIKQEEKKLNNFVDSFEIKNEWTEILGKLHKLRLSFKRYRYLSEIIKNVTNSDSQILKNMQGIQDQLGEIQDSQVFLNSIRDFYKNSNTIYNYRLNKVFKDLIKKQNQSVINFFNNKEELLSLNY